MLQLAIIRTIDNDNKRFSLLLEGNIGEFEREIASRVGIILGPKESYSRDEIDGAIARAFKEYKRDFKKLSIKLR